MVQNITQWGMTVEQGQMDLQVPGTVFSCQVGSGVSGSVVPGQPVKIEDSAGGVPKVVPLAANTDKTFGFVTRNAKDADFVANEVLEIAADNSVMYMTAGGAIARGAKVEVVYTTSKVITSGGTNPVVGIALDKAAANNDLIRVWIQSNFRQ